MEGKKHGNAWQCCVGGTTYRCWLVYLVHRASVINVDAVSTLPKLKFLAKISFSDLDDFVRAGLFCNQDE